MDGTVVKIGLSLCIVSLLFKAENTLDVLMLLNALSCREDVDDSLRKLSDVLIL